MNLLAFLRPETIHHAYIVEGDSASSRAAVLGFLNNAFGMQPGHSDLFILDRPDFGVDDAQEIIDINSRKPTQGALKAVIISLNSISHQAQNSLLKVLEEPRPGTVFFILTQVSSMFLPTVLSRVHVLKEAGEEKARDASRGASHKGAGDDKKTDKKREAMLATLSPEHFLNADKAERIATAKRIADMKSDEKIGDAEVFAFVQGIEKLAYEQSRAESSVRTAVAKAFTKVDEYARDASSSKKMLLEYLALMLPEIE